MRTGDRALTGFLGLVLGVGLVTAYANGPQMYADGAELHAGTSAARVTAADDIVKLDSYAEWKRGNELVVDGQRVRVDEATKWKGKFTRLADVPLGDEVRVTGVRQGDGSVLAREFDVRPNGDNALFESDVRAGTAQLEAAWLRERVAFEPAGDGQIKKIGEVSETGPRVDRVRRLVDRLAPPYVDRGKLRVYVIDNKDWNAMAMGNGAIWVFSGIMNDMNDNELAIVVGHELTHYTHEHSRRQARRGIWTQMAGLGVLLAAEAVKSEALKASIAVGASLTLSALTAGYGRDLEDQADRVGLRYAYEGGFPVRGAPLVWQRFLDKYGQENRITNFFFSDHSQASARKKNLELEIANNYR
jgi:Zn-dependent protease with chaperone function